MSDADDMIDSYLDRLLDIADEQPKNKRKRAQRAPARHRFSKVRKERRAEGVSRMNDTPPTPTSAAEPRELKTRHLWSLIESIRKNEIGADHSEARSTPNWVVWALLDDLKALDARIDELEAENRELSRMVSLEFEQAMKEGDNE